jgi:hypothetical protein
VYPLLLSKAISITQADSLFVALGFKHAMGMRYIACHLCPAPCYGIFPHYLINGTIFEKRYENNMCFDYLYNVYLKHFSFWEQLSEI